jgi:hypothetical protein
MKAIMIGILIGYVFSAVAGLLEDLRKPEDKNEP